MLLHLKSLEHTGRVSGYFVWLRRYMMKGINFIFLLKQLILGENYIDWIFFIYSVIQYSTVICPIWQRIWPCERYHSQLDMDLALMGLCSKEVVMTNTWYTLMH